MFGLGADDKKDKKKTGEEVQKPIIEEIEVTGKTPAQQPISSVSLVREKELLKTVPRNLGEVMNLSSGVYVTEGGKSESSIKIRGLASNRVTLMYDGIPIYEPYFGSFDLKSISTANVESVKVIKGTHSVLYGPNSLGGVLNVVTRRPSQPYFTLTADGGADSTYFINGNGGYTWDRFAFLANASVDTSDGFRYFDDGEKVLREGSDYTRSNFSGKFYFYPTDRSELMAQVLYYTADYGIPAATEYSRARYWRFSDWDRWQVNLGGMFPIFGDGLLKFRTYYVQHFNVLDAYDSAALEDLWWSSTYKNSSLGAFMLGEVPLAETNTLKFSLNASANKVRQQGDIGEDWEEFNRDVYSLAVEDHIGFSDKFRLVVGASLDYLLKHNDETETKVNPIAGVKYTPNEWLDIHMSFSRKSRFPSMKSLYSSKSGNPDLTSEMGDNYEVGFVYKKNIYVSGAVFYNSITDLIQSYRGLDGFHNYRNVGRADIFGVELDLRKRIGLFDIQINYTYLDAEDKDENLPLDYTPKSRLNLFMDIGPVEGFTLSIWNIAVSGSQARMGKYPPFDMIDIPGYVLLNARLEKQLGMVTLYVKAENLLDKDYFAEPGFPMKARTFSAGFRLDLGGK
jgi:iron complex outermembrane receptor protein